MPIKTNSPIQLLEQTHRKWYWYFNKTLFTNNESLIIELVTRRVFPLFEGRYFNFGLYMEFHHHLDNLSNCNWSRTKTPQFWNNSIIKKFYSKLAHQKKYHPIFDITENKSTYLIIIFYFDFYSIKVAILKIKTDKSISERTEIDCISCILKQHFRIFVYEI